MGIFAYPQYPPGYPPQPPHQHTWVVNGAPIIPVFITNRYPRCGEVIEIGWSSPGIKDMDQCSTCGLYQEEGAHLVSISDGNAGGVFGHFENGEFKEGWENYPTAYKCPNTPGVVTLSFTVDDDGTLADDPQNTREIKITVWDFTITDCPTDWKPEFLKTLPFHLEIKPDVDHNGNSLASYINCSLSSSCEPGICKNMILEPEDEYHWDLQFQASQNFNVTSSDPTQPKKRDRAVSTQPLTEATVIMACYDYGAYGTLTAVANIPNIGLKTARVKDKPDRTAVKIPLDEDNNYIADAWEGNQGQPLDDNDVIPQSALAGDGIYRYDEYRGFYVWGEHIRTNPNKKDVFVYDRDALGLGYFDKLGIEIHEHPIMGSDNLITRFDSPDKHSRNQYAILLVEDRNVYPPKYEPLGKTCPVYPALNMPNVTCTIYTNHIRYWVADKYEKYKEKYDSETAYQLVKNIAIAHELGHGVNLPEGDRASGHPYCIMNPWPDWANLEQQTVYCDICKQIFILYMP